MDRMSHMDQIFLNKITQIVDNHIDDEEFGVKELCRELGVSRSKLHRKLNLLTGKSTSQIIREFRLERSMVIPTNPYFDALHTEPDFIQLMKRIGLDEILDTNIKS